MTVNVHEPVAGPAWVDHSSKHVPGLFPLSVERVFNQVVAEHALAVTTVTTGARYYALHGLVAQEATNRGLDDDQARDLLRRCEVAIALATLAHQGSDDHNPNRGAIPHAADRLRVLWRAGPVDLPKVARDGDGTYIQAKWGVLGSTYRGAEMTMKVMDPSGFAPGPGYDDSVVRAALGDVFDLAEMAHVSQEAASAFGHLCLCRAATGPDASWLRGVFTAPGAQPGTRGHRQAQTTRMLARAIKYGDIEDEHRDLMSFLMSRPEAIDSGDGEAVSRRWRGIAYRYESVNAWRYLWQALSDEVASHGLATRQQMRDWLADYAPSGTVRSFTTSLPDVVDSMGAPLLAERHRDVRGLEEVLGYVAVACIGANRLEGLHQEERFGFEGGPDTPNWALEEELSPRWVRRRTEAWADRQMRDFMAALSDVLIDRAQRLSLQKTRFDLNRGVVIPGRIHTRDDLVYRVYAEQARPAATRLPQLVSMCRQVGLFDPPARTPQAGGASAGISKTVWSLTGEGVGLV